MNITGTAGHHWRQQMVFFSGYGLFAITASVFLLLVGKENSFVLLNGFHRPWLDQFFIYYTDVGDGLFSAFLAIFIFFFTRRRKLAVNLLLAWVVTGILAQVAKRIAEAPRPLAYFSPKTFPFFISEVIHSGNNSFPSGHTVTVFAGVTVLALYSNNKWHQLFLLLAAILVAYSRIYLSQHFLIDVLAGSLIGMLGALCCVYVMRNLNETRLFATTKQRKDSDGNLAG